MASLRRLFVAVGFGERLTRRKGLCTPDVADWLKNVREAGTQLELLQPADDFAERLHRQQPLAQAPL
jgi:hypothetical protein